MKFVLILGNSSEKETSAMAPNSYFLSILGLSDFPHLKQFWLVHATCRASNVSKRWVRVSNQRGKTRYIFLYLHFQFYWYYTPHATVHQLFKNFRMLFYRQYRSFVTGFCQYYIALVWINVWRKIGFREQMEENYHKC